MAEFSTHSLYGGAISSLLPSTYIDASTLRQIPDHQEVFLSPTSLTSVIFEINQFVDAATANAARVNAAQRQSTTDAEGASGASGASGSTGPSSTTSDAALYHVKDLLAPGDSLIEMSVPESVALQGTTLSGVQAAAVKARIESPATIREEKSTTSIRLLLVRLEKQRTDLCVAVNVPWKELGAVSVAGREQDGQGRGKVEEEEGFAEEVIRRVAGSLEVRDWGLFGE